MGAKNHCVILPDADKDDCINAIVSAAFGVNTIKIQFFLSLI